jgi:hypothetical protein
MKSTRSFIFFLIIGFFSASQGFSYEQQGINRSEKIYVQLNQVLLSQNGIYVHLNNEWVPTEAIHLDTEGLYVTDNAIGDWKCPNTGRDSRIDFWAGLKAALNQLKKRGLYRGVIQLPFF